MSVFMFQGSYSAEAIKSLIANPTDRSGAARAVIEANGGTMVGAWMAFGESDVVVIAEMPDDESMAAVAMAIAATGAIVNGKSTRLLESVGSARGKRCRIKPTPQESSSHSLRPSLAQPVKRQARHQPRWREECGTSVVCKSECKWHA